MRRRHTLSCLDGDSATHQRYRSWIGRTEWVRQTYSLCLEDRSSTGSNQQLKSPPSRREHELRSGKEEKKVQKTPHHPCWEHIRRQALPLYYIISLWHWYNVRLYLILLCEGNVLVNQNWDLPGFGLESGVKVLPHLPWQEARTIRVMNVCFL